MKGRWKMKLTDKTVSDLLAAFRSSEPTPGGGSASALAGALGASLLAMVAALAKPRASTENETAELRDGGMRCSELAAQLETLIDRDTDAYNSVIAAYRLPKGTEEEKAMRSEQIQDALQKAIEAPLEVMRRCADALQVVAIVDRLGNANAVSDIRVATYLLRAGLAGAGENVGINLAGLKNAAYVERVREETAALISNADQRLMTER